MSNKAILVVENDVLSRTALVDLLVRNGFETVEAENGVAAMDVFRAGEFMAVITDLRMPKMSGLELLKKIRTRDADVPVILVTAYGSVQTAVEAMKEGASDYVTKPFDAQEILTVLSRQANIHQLREENRSLRRQIGAQYGLTNIVGRSEGMRTVFEQVNTVVDSLATVLIQGESGTGKELVARALHFNSARAKGPFVPVSCAALTETLLESELFGHEKGAFTGATTARSGRIEVADGGTLFLDDVDDIPLKAQVKLLRVLQERVVERVGTHRPRSVDVRVVAATKVDLRKKIGEGEFREDLYYRLSVIPIHIPPLRHRKEDISPLVSHFLDRFCEREKCDAMRLSPECIKALEAYTWPGNVRELENVVERLVATCPGPTCGLDALPPELVNGRLDEDVPLPSTFPKDGIDLLGELDRVESRIIRWALARTGGNKSKTARLLQLSRSTLADHMRRLQLEAGDRS